MQLLAFGLIVTAGLLIQCEPSATQITTPLENVNLNDPAEQFYLGKIRGLIKEYVEKVNRKSFTIVLDKVTKRVYDYGPLYYCSYTATAGVSKKCTAFGFFAKNKEPTLTTMDCLF